MRPLKILGAGLSGLCAAINLARAGYRVQVFDKRAEVGMRFNGDLQALRNWLGPEDILSALARMNLGVDFPHTPVTSLGVTNGKALFTYRFARPLDYMVRRGSVHGSLDLALKQQALDSGVELFLGKTLPQSQVDIVATGPLPGKTIGVARGLVFRTDAPDSVLCLLDQDAAPGGYAYLIVAGGHACLCTVLFRDFSRLSRAFHRSRDILLSNFTGEFRDARPMGGRGSFSGNPVFVRGGVLRVGEAAGLQDLAWGFGMDMALESGHLAARCIIHGLDYPSLARRRFLPMLKASVVNRFFWDALATGPAFYLAALSVLGPGAAALALRASHRYTPFHRCLYPLARRRLERDFPRSLRS